MLNPAGGLEVLHLNSDEVISDLPTWPSYDQDEIAAATDALRGGCVNYWTGEQGREFEREFSSYLGTSHAVAVSNGSVALACALRALSLRPGAEVIVSPRTFVASVSEILLAGALPVFADVDPGSQNITPESIEPLINKRTAAIVAVHVAGWPCDMPRINALAELHGLAVIEDCAQSHGAEIAGRKAGSWGDMATFSFCQDKIISTGGEGGAIATDNDEYQQRCWSFKDHGKYMEAVDTPSAGQVFKWVHNSIGTNGRLTEFQAAIGRCQLLKLDNWVEQRNRNARVLANNLHVIGGIRIPEPPDNIRHAYYKFYAFVRADALRKSWSRERILREMVAQNIPCGSGVCPEVYLEKAFSGLSSRPQERLPVARELGETSLMLLVHPTMDESHMGRIAHALTEVMARATR
jgi:dTDP-4-amino-4,6-dideoxygalactose transaminase